MKTTSSSRLIPLKYRRWKRQARTTEEIGIKSFITDRMYRETMETIEKVIKCSADLMAVEMSKKMFLDGMEHTDKIYHEHQRDPIIRGWEQIFVVENYKSCLKEQYLYQIFREWNSLYGDVFTWENLSLGEYLSYWLRRTRAWKLLWHKTRHIRRFFRNLYIKREEDY